METQCFVLGNTIAFYFYDWEITCECDHMTHCDIGSEIRRPTAITIIKFNPDGLEFHCHQEQNITAKCKLKEDIEKSKIKNLSF